MHEPDDDSEYRRLFNCPLFFGHPVYRLSFDAAFRGSQPVTYDPQLGSAIDPYVTLERTRRSETECRPSHLAVRNAIERLSPKNASIESVAESLGLKPRTLQHKLTQEGTTYRDVLDEVRKPRALTGVRTGVDLQRLANELGYQDVTAFHRAFRRWTGMAPHEFLESEAPEPD